MKERKLNRLRNYDYSENGFYFVTICTHNRIHWFGEIDDRKMILNQRGEITHLCWKDLPSHYTNIKLDEYVVMPNHLHGIVIVGNDETNVGNRHAGPTARHRSTKRPTGARSSGACSLQTADLRTRLSGIYQI